MRNSSTNNNTWRMQVLVFLQLFITFSVGQLITFGKGGEVGVNFLGFKASAGIANGLHAAAETPFGQRAGAGIASPVSRSDGTVSGGGLYAHAQALDGLGAGAGINGETGPSAVAFGPVPVSTYVEKRVQKISPTLSGSSSVELVEKPTSNIGVIPVASPVEAEVPVNPVIIEKTVIRNRPHLRRKYAYVNARAAAGVPSQGKIKVINIQSHQTPSNATDSQEIYGTQQTQVTATVNKNNNLFDDIFNIPISALRAVNQLLNNIAGSVTVSKNVTVAATPIPKY